MPAGQPAWWGWHQLTDSYARRLVTEAAIERGDLVLDVGAGTGSITAHLVAAGARVIAIELHPGRAATLRSRFHDDAVKVVRCDAADLRLPHRSFVVVANPPFAITTALLRRLLSPASRLRRADLVVPDHVARRWASGRTPGARRWQAVFDARVGARVPDHAFRPAGPPAVILTIERRPVS